jgi:hypothetical protein
MVPSALARRGAAIAATSLPLLLGSGGAALAQSSFVEVSREGSRFSVDAAGVNVSTVLLALGREAGFRVQDSRPDADRPPVDIELTDATLEQTLARLLERQNHLIVYRSGAPAEQAEPGAIERIVLLGPRSEQPSVPTKQQAGTSPLAGPVQSPPIARAADGAAPSEPAAPPGAAPDPAEANVLAEAAPPDPESEQPRFDPAAVAAGSFAGPGVRMTDEGHAIAEAGEVPPGEEPEELPDPEAHFPIGEGTLLTR